MAITSTSTTSTLAADRDSFYGHDQNTHTEKVNLSIAAVLQQLARTVRFDEKDIDAVVNEFLSQVAPAVRGAVQSRLQRLEPEHDVVLLPETDDQGNAIKLHLPPEMVLAVVYLALKDEAGWSCHSTVSDRVQLLREMIQAHQSCNTGLRNAMVEYAAGHSALKGFKIVTVFQDFLVEVIDTYVRDTLNQETLINEHFSDVVIPWLETDELPPLLQERINPAFIAGLETAIKKAVQSAGIVLNDKDQRMIETYCQPETLLGWRFCLSHPLALRLKAWDETYGLGDNKAYFATITEPVLTWLKTGFDITNRQHLEKIDTLIELSTVLNTLRHEGAFLHASGKIPGDLLNALTAMHEPGHLHAFLEDTSPTLATQIATFKDCYAQRFAFKGFISNYLALWFQSEHLSAERGALFNYLHRPDVQEAVCLTDHVLDPFLQKLVAQFQTENSADLKQYWVNRFILHACLVPVSQWTRLFYETFETIVNFINHDFNARNDGRLATLKHTSYPPLLQWQLHVLLATYRNMHDPETHPTPVCADTPLALETVTLVERMKALLVAWSYLRKDHTVTPEHSEYRRLLEKIRLVRFAPEDLFLAVRQGDISMLELLLENEDICGQLLLARDAAGDTALMCAATEGHLDIVNRLLRLLENEGTRAQLLLAKSNIGYTALICAAGRGHLDIVNRLLENEGTRAQLLLAQDRYGQTALMNAVYNNNLDMVNLLLEKDNTRGQLLLVKNNVNGWTALMCAAANGHLDIVRCLLEKDTHGQLLLAQDGHGKTALRMASSRGHTAMVDLLREKEASVFADDALLHQVQDDETPLNGTEAGGAFTSILTYLTLKRDAALTSQEKARRYEERLRHFIRLIATLSDIYCAPNRTDSDDATRAAAIDSAAKLPLPSTVAFWSSDRYGAQVASLIHTCKSGQVDSNTVSDCLQAINRLIATPHTPLPHGLKQSNPGGNGYI